jgi:hypothetical protein
MKISHGSHQPFLLALSLENRNRSSSKKHLFSGETSQRRRRRSGSDLMMSGQDVLVEVLKCMATSATRWQGHVWHRHGFDLGLGRGATHFFLSPAMPHHKSGSSGLLISVAYPHSTYTAAAIRAMARPLPPPVRW